MYFLYLSTQSYRRVRFYWWRVIDTISFFSLSFFMPTYLSYLFPIPMSKNQKFMSNTPNPKNSAHLSCDEWGKWSIPGQSLQFYSLISKFLYILYVFFFFFFSLFLFFYFFLFCIFSVCPSRRVRLQPPPHRGLRNPTSTCGWTTQATTQNTI